MYGKGFEKREALAREDIYFAEVQGKIVGTGSIRGNEICRLFILPEYQAKGYGNRLMDLLEDVVFGKYPSTDPGAYLSSLEKMALLSVERVFPAHHSLDIQPEIIGRMRDAFQGLKESGKLRYGSGTFDYGDWAVWL